MLVANARMYSVEAASAAAWRALLAWVARRAEAALRYIEHDGPLDALWRRADVGCALMCGYPWATWNASVAPRPVPLAAPAPRGSDGKPRYRSCIVVRDDSPIVTLSDLRGRRFAYTMPGSQSGYEAARRMFADLATGGRLFGDVVGPLATPRRVVDALLAGDADAGPLDSYWFELLMLHEPRAARGLRVIARTPWTPLPLFVCSAAVDAPVRSRLAHALVAAGSEPALAGVRATLSLAAIAAIDPAAYAVLAADAARADALGYPLLQ